MNKLFLWLIDIEQYSIDKNIPYAKVMLNVLNTAKQNGYECSESFESSMCNDPPIKGISLEVDDVDGLCISARIDKSHFKHTTVDKWLSWKNGTEE
jgi:hypothetical protein